MHYFGDDDSLQFASLSEQHVKNGSWPHPTTRRPWSSVCRSTKRLWHQCPYREDVALKPMYRAGAGFWQCSARRYVAVLNCAYVDEDDVVFDEQTAYGRHVSGGPETNFRPKKTFPFNAVPHFDEIAVHFGVGGAATGHFLNQLPRLFHLIVGTPPHVPIAIRSNAISERFVSFLIDANIVSPDRFRRFCFHKDHEKGRTMTEFCQRQQNFRGLFAKRMYFAGEFVRDYSLDLLKVIAAAKTTNKKLPVVPLPTPGKPWFSFALEICSWQFAQPRSILRDVMACHLDTPTPVNVVAPQKECRITVVNRKDAKSRMLRNHGGLMTGLRKRHPECRLFEFVGASLSLEAQIRAFATADLVIAPHGAALGYVGFMRPGAAVLEITYRLPDRIGPLIFFAAAQSAGLRYFLSFATDGKHSTPLTADLTDVLDLVDTALAPTSNIIPS